ncbi:TonB-dependent receptor [Solimonas flava]|uniref:TonB-dependent receptor n=1 Tax=Solimonas flava TaxID=415849 RepID=UPI0003FD7BA5|nr:TonB-dependent receptor [Solimonas flava]
MPHRRLTPVLVRSSLCLLALAAASARADQNATAPPPVTGNGDGETPVETIIVTGEKSGRTLQHTTTSVAVVTAARIEQENLQELADVLNRTANVSQTYGSAGYTIRGIRNVDGAGGSPLATIYLDGSALPSEITGSGPTAMWDLAQVEVLRGPQSTIQGENALAGAIVLRSQDATMDWDARARAQYADPDDRRFAFAGGGPIVDDELAFRVAVERRDFDGFVDNVTRQRPEDAIDSTIARGKLRWQPRARPGLTARLNYLWSDYDGPYLYTYSRTDTPDYDGHRVSTADAPNDTATRGRIASLTLDDALDARWKLASVSAWNQIHSLRHYDGDQSPDSESYGLGDLHFETWSQELRASYGGERLSGLVGLYGSRRETRNDTASRTNVTTPTQTISSLLQGGGLPADQAESLAALYATALPVIPVDYSSLNPTRAEDAAIFADGHYRLTQRLFVLAGFRYDRARYTTANDTTAVFAGTYPDPDDFGAYAPAIDQINQGVAGMVSMAAGSTPRSTRSFNAFLPKLGLRYEWNPELSAALVAQRGYRSGGSSFNTARSQVFPYDPEYTWNYEGSLRSQWFDRRLMVNANVYYVDWTDKQATAYFGLNSYDYNTVNAGKAHLYGVEIEAAHRVDRAFDWYASASYSRTKYDEFKVSSDSVSVDDYSGAEFAYAPHWTAAVGANWRFAEGWRANLNANYRGAVYNDTGSDARRLSSRTLVNARLGYDATHWGAYAYASNLLDRSYIQYRWTRDEGFAILGDPRVLGVGVEARW